MTSRQMPRSVSIPDLSNPVTVLALGCTSEDRTSLRKMSLEAGWSVTECAEFAQASPLIETGRAGVLLCAERVGSSQWQDVLKFAAEQNDPPMVIVVARHADEGLWAEVLNLGAFDLLQSPLERSETIRVINGAGLHGKPEPRVPVQANTGTLRATA